MKLLILFLLPLSLCAQTPDKSNSGSDKAVAFINSLTATQRQKAVFAFDEMNRYEWHYLPAATAKRNGVGVYELDSLSKQYLYALMHSYLSDEGFTKTKNIMDFEYLLKELQPENKGRIPENYFVAIYGNPDKDQTWGWKFGGHHIALNFTIVDNKLAFSPFFFGVFPAEVKEGARKGTRVLKQEEDLGFDLVKSLTLEQQSKAIFQLTAFNEIVTTNTTEVSPLEPVGIFAKDFTPTQKTILNKLIVAYLLAMPKEIAKIRMQKIVKEDINLISFGWAGAAEPGKPHYYRIQGKSFLIEFDNTQSNANHIHTVWRDFNGDYGRDLLKEHYQKFHKQ